MVDPRVFSTCQSKSTEKPGGRAAPALLPGVFLMINSFETGGSERQFVALSNSLKRDGFRVHLGCIMRRGALSDGIGQVPSFRLGGSLYGWKALNVRIRLARHLRRNDIQVAHAYDFYTNLTLVPAALLARVPVIIGSQRQLGDLLTPAQFRAQVEAFRWCDAVVCNSQAAANRLIAARVPASKIAVIGNGLELSAFADTEPALPRIPGHLRVGMIARMNSRSKNHSLFLRAAAKLCHANSSLEFVLVGDGPLRRELENQAQSLGCRDQVLFLGDRRDIPAILASLDISVLPSASESLSNAVLESMAAGLPVIASRVGGSIELLGEGKGILISATDEDELACAIEDLVRAPRQRCDMGTRAREFASANFSLDLTRKRHEELYTELWRRKMWRRKPISLRKESAPGPRLRVATIAASLGYVGGQSVQADLLLRNWQHDPAVEASFIPIDPVLPGWIKWVNWFPGLRTIVRLPFYLAALWRGLGNADIAHVFSASYWSFLVAPVPAWIIARLRGRKVLIHYHSGEARDHLRRFRSARPVLASADRLVVPSGYLVDVFREFGLTADIVPNVVDLSQFTYRPRSPLRPHLVCTRGFHRYYGIDVVVRAFAELKKRFPEAQLDLVGGGATEASVRQLVRELNLSGVNFAGVAGREEIARFYDRADVFINASCLDNMPISILEAFASGTPVISTAPESLPYFVDHERTGLLSPVGDPQALARNVVRVLTDAELARQLALNAYQELRKYEWPVVRSRWLEVYRALVLCEGESAAELMNAIR